MIKSFLCTACVLTMAPPAVADNHKGHYFDGLWDKDRFQIRARAIGILADGDGNIDGSATQTNVDDAYVPEVDFTYFLKKNWALELIAATAQHNVEAGGVELGSTWILPPTVTLQYHFTPDKQWSPYIGAGLNYSLFYGEDETGATQDLDIDNGVGIAVQAGVDYWLNDKWGLNADIKYIDLNTDVSVSNGTTRASDVDIDPIIVGVGISRRF